MLTSQMQSFELDLVIINESEHAFAKVGTINSSEVHRVMLTNVSWIPFNWLIVINETMRQRLELGLNNALPSQYLDFKLDNTISIRGTYRTCQEIYLSLDPTAKKFQSIGYPVLVPDLPVDFILGTLFFNELNIKWSSKLKRLITRGEEEAH